MVMGVIPEISAHAVSDKKVKTALTRKVNRSLHAPAHCRLGRGGDCASGPALNHSL